MSWPWVLENILHTVTSKFKCKKNIFRLEYFYSDWEKEKLLFKSNLTYSTTIYYLSKSKWIYWRSIFKGKTSTFNIVCFQISPFESFPQRPASSLELESQACCSGNDAQVKVYCIYFANMENLRQSLGTKNKTKRHSSK